MANNVTRYNQQPTMVPMRSIVDQLFENSWLSPTVADRFFNGFEPRSTVSANLIETKDTYIVQLALPGVDTSKLDLQVVERTLRVTGAFSFPQIENAKYIWHGLQDGEFNQVLTLPAEVVGDGAEASYNDGVLSITLPKAEKARVKSIPVKKSV